MNEAHMRYSSAKELVQTIQLALSSPDYKGSRVEGAVRPTQMMAGFAVELYLKAWLLADGMPPGDVQKFGHKLADLHTEALSRGFPAFKAIAAMVKTLAEPHGQNRDYVYRYTKPEAEIDVLNWGEAIPIFQTLDSVVDVKSGARASFGLAPSQPHPSVI